MMVTPFDPPTMEALETVLLYRIAYVSASEAHSVVRPLAEQPVPGDRIALDAHTVITVRKVVAHAEDDTIAADVIAEATGASGESEILDNTASTLAAPVDRSSRLP